MTRPESRDERSHGEEYPASDPDTGTEEERYGAKGEPPKPDRRHRDEPKPAAPPPSHERSS
ncbi:MAG TPA: hypothetical protein VFI18_02265 [Gaiellales bacterium]|nr:hypothetical protein [Gaiellales bacterium]